MTTAPTSDQHVTLVRHGESTWNDAKRIQGQNNEALLTDEGREQAREVAKSLRNLGFRRLVTSDLARAFDTAALIGTSLGLELEIDPLLRERDFGELEGQQLSSRTNEISGIVDGVLVDPDATPPGGESFRDVVARAQQFLDRVRREGQPSRLLVITHGGTIRALRAASSSTTLEGMTWDAVGNCSVWRINPHVTR